MSAYPQYGDLYKYNSTLITKVDFTTHMNEVYEYLTPMKLPFVDNATQYIKEAMIKDKPVALLIGLNSKVDCDITYPTYTGKDRGISRHWVTITEIKQDNIADEVLIKISTWGGYGYIDLKDVIEEEPLYASLIYFE